MSTTCKVQAHTITSLQEVIEAKERDNSLLTNQNLSQTQVIARLNEERFFLNRKILVLQQEKSALQLELQRRDSTCEANLANLDKGDTKDSRRNADYVK